VRCHTEFCSWIETDDPVTEDDAECLVLTFATYLTQAGGKPEIKAYLGDKLLCITAAAIAEPSSVIRNKKADMAYIRDAVNAALKEAGLIEAGSQAG
jgi:hypothetical protein